MKTKSNGKINVKGTERSASIFVTKGWNLIGNPTPLKIKLTDFTKSIEGNWQKLLYYSQGKWFGADASVPSSFWTLEKINSGAGYWLNMIKNDTLNVSRIPLVSNSQNLIVDKNNIFSTLTHDIKLQSSESENNFNSINVNTLYRLTIPKPSGFYGSIIIKNSPAPIGSKILACIQSVQNLPDTKITIPGQYNLLLLNGDDPQTKLIEGGKEGEIVQFKITTPDGETYISDVKGSWQEGVNQRLNLSALSLSDSSLLPINIELYVDKRTVGKEIVDGDPISKKSIITAQISGGKSQIANENVKLFLNSELIDNSQYSFSVNDNNSKLIYYPTKLTDGYYTLKIEVVEYFDLTTKYLKEFSFQISTKLKLDKIVNFPNPMQTDTKFTYYLFNDLPAKVTIKIYTVAGRLIRVIDSASNEVGYNESYWDGTDEYGDKIANGV